MNNSMHTLITLPLKDLRPFDMNPRLTHNADYEEIKASVRLRGLDHPPHITQRPGELFYIIANGGNTRLAVLNELWQETHDDRYRSITCLFHPWQTEKSIGEGNLHCLLGHLIENEMRGSLTFIERALGVCRARELYQQTSPGSLSQTRLAQRLRDDGFPATQPDISKMESAVELLLPHIPDVLYGGLFCLGVEKILLLRSNAGLFWHQHATDNGGRPLFDDIFALALTSFNGPPAGFSYEHLRDELTGLMSQALNIDYNTIALVTDSRNQKRWQLLGVAEPTLPEVARQRTCQLPAEEKKARQPDDIPEKSDATSRDASDDPSRTEEFIPLPVSEGPVDNNADTPTPLPQSRGRPGDPEMIWPIDSLKDTPEYLAPVADQAAWELAATACLEHLVTPSERSGFDIASPEGKLSTDAMCCSGYWRFSPESCRAKQRPGISC
ncbi:ParB family protein [Cronobacter dublinensis]|uniref:ParB family protein n=1 Tax=Cronobacter dublinensis TaxID=413497 RepID=UPI000CFD7E32|nr:ParB family protein [Cronobacter dublinensis]MDT3605746.1 chromosome partitioning protein ParB [Cronobacter dublinensis]